MPNLAASQSASSPAAGPGKTERTSEGRGSRPRLTGVRRALALFLAFSVPLNACYRYVPVETVEPGLRVALELNDRGRAELSDSIGQAVRIVEGTVNSANGEAYDLRVHTIRQFSGQSYAWSGEPLRVPRAYVGQTRERQLDKGRSWALGIGVAALVAVLIISTDLLAGSQPLGEPPVEPPTGTQ